FWDNYDLMPTYLGTWLSLKPTTNLGAEWGVFTINGKPFLTGALEESSGVYTLTHIRKFFPVGDDEVIRVRYDDGLTPPSFELQQIFVIRAPFRDILMHMLASTDA